VFYSAHQLVLAKVLQIPNVAAFQLTTCMLGQHFGTDSVVGTWNAHAEILADYGNACLVLSLRANSSLTAAMGRVVRLKEALKRKAHFIVLDPRLSEAASKALHWLPVKPGTDQAVLLAIIREVIHRQTYDDDFLRTYTNAPFLAFSTQEPMVQLAMETDEEGGQPMAFYVYDELQERIVAVPPVSNGNLQDREGNPIQPALEVPEGTTWEGQPVKTVFQFLAERVEPCTAGWAADVCGVPAEQIALVAEEFALAQPALVDPGWHDARYAGSIQTWRTAAILQVLKGGIDREGGWIFNAGYREGVRSFWEAIWQGERPSKGVGLKKAAGLAQLFGTPDNWEHGRPAVPAVWSAQQWEAGEEGVAYTSMTYPGYPEAMKGDLTYNGEPYSLKAVFIFGSNIVRSAYSDQTWKEALSSDEVALVVGYDILPTDTMLYADVILPDYTYLERGDPLFHAETPDLAYVARYPVDPLVDGQHMLDVFIELAARFGKYEQYIQALAGFFGWDPEALKQAVDQARSEGTSVGVPLREMTIGGLAQKLGRPREEVEQTLAEQGVLLLHTQDEMVEEAGIPYKYPAPTPSGRLELYSLFFAGFAKQYGYMPNWDPLVAFVPPDWREGLGLEDAPEEDEFFVTHGRLPTMTHTSTADNDLLMAISQAKGGLYMGVWLNATRAERLGIQSGDLIELENTATGQRAQGVAYLTEYIRPDTLFMASGYGHENTELRTAAGVGVALSKLIPYRLDPVVGIPETCQLTLRVRKV